MSKPLTTNSRARNQQSKSRHAQQLQLLELQVRNRILAEARTARADAAATRKKMQGGSNS